MFIKSLKKNQNNYHLATSNVSVFSKIKNFYEHPSL